VSPGDADDAWQRAPVGLLRLDRDGRVLAANRTLLAWLDAAADRVHARHVGELLTVGGRLYWETHLAPLLLVEGRLDEVALELRHGPHRLPVLLSAVVVADTVEVALSSARERRRFESELQAARAAARAAERQVRALQSVTAALSRAVGVEAVGRALLDAVTGSLRADGGTLWLTAPDGRLERFGATGRPVAAEVAPDLAPDLALDGASDGSAVARADGDPLLLPLRGLEGLRGVLVLRPASGAGADPLDVEVCTAVAQQAALALDRAHTHDQSASVAHQLQVALLAVEPPADARYDLATFYRPGVASLEVGGDWYDVFLSAPGVLSVLVGDVVGRGLSAASAMGQLRSAVRALAAPGVRPGAVLAGLDRFVEQVPDASMATLVYAEVHLATGRVRYGCAGHPPPLLLGADGAARLLFGGRSAPLGALTAPRHRPDAELLLSPGERLLLCTDGLFERRGQDVDEGLQRLVDSGSHLQRASLQGVVHVVTRALLADEQSHDDVCVLLVQWCGDDFEHRLPADLVGLSAARQALGGWLRERGVEEPARANLVLAASEALANAAEHGAGGRAEEQVSLRARVQPVAEGPDEVVLEVRDGGRWRTATSAGDRGRGLMIMRALVDTVDVHTDAGTRVVLRRRLEAAS